VSAPVRHLLFGTERYAVPILRPLAAASAVRGERVAWCLPGVDTQLAPGAERLAHWREVRRYAPDSVLAAANVVPPFFPGIKVQLFHGFSVDKRSHARGHFRVRGLFDLYCTQGPDTTEPFRALAERLGHFRVVETGWPKLDPMFRPDPAELATLRAGAAGRAVVAFGSTFTQSLSAAPVLLPELERLVASGRWYWLLTLHPKCAPELQRRYRALAGPNARFVESESLPLLLAAADVLVADTSSIVSEFLCLERPVVTFRHRRPGPQHLEIDEPARLEPALESALGRPEPLMGAIREYARRIHPSRDGHASARVLDAVAAFGAEGRRGLARKPLNLLRRLQLRLRYGGALA
jgi:hypothetical protein